MQICHEKPVPQFMLDSAGNHYSRCFLHHPDAAGRRVETLHFREDSL